MLTWKCASRHNGAHFFDISTCKSAPKLRCFVHFDFEMFSRQTGAQFFISHRDLARWLRTRRFSEPTFRPSGATNQWKNTVNRCESRLFCLFEHLHLLSFDSFSSLIFFLLSSSLLFSSLLFSDSSHLCFSICHHLSISVHIVGSLTSKLPSTNKYISISS